MPASPEQLAWVRAVGRTERLSQPTTADQARRALAGIIDTGMMDDDDVLQLWAAYEAERNPKAER